MFTGGVFNNRADFRLRRRVRAESILPPCLGKFPIKSGAGVAGAKITVTSKEQDLRTVTTDGGGIIV